MDVWTSLSEGEQQGVWLLSSLFLFLFAFVVCPVAFSLRQRKFRARIANHIITSSYKLPEEMTPAELSYMFSSSIKRQHVFASIMQLTNEGILTGLMFKGMYMVRIGPRVDSKMTLASGYTIDTVENNEQIQPIKLTEGSDTYTVPNTQEKVNGSKLYVYWWLIREGLRQRGVIVVNPVKAYVRVVLLAQVKLLMCTLATIAIIQLLIMMFSGDIDLGSVGGLLSTYFLWAVFTLPVTFVVGFIVVRIRGRFLGRHWILTEKKRRLLNQFDAFREYVRLVQEGSALFESEEAEKRAKLKTLPYAVALGYAKVPQQFTPKNK